MTGGDIAIINASQLVTCAGFKAKTGPEMGSLGIIEDGAVIIKNGNIDRLGPIQELRAALKGFSGEVIDAKGRAVLPGFVDPHTHFVFAGYRDDEFDLRLKGTGYLKILARGGGILSTVGETRRATADQLFESGWVRLDRMAQYGVTTVEGKSGYGLDLATEVKQLEVMQRLDQTHPVDVVPTFLGAHATPAEYTSRTDDYVEYVCNSMIPQVAASGLAEFCDVFCDRGVFSYRQAEKILKEAQYAGLKLKLHADEMVDLGGAALAAEVGAVSADHLLHAAPDGIAQMAGAGVIATLLPATAFNLKEPYADARAIVDAGCPVALASDFNPGSSFTHSIPLLFALATLYMRLTIEETVTALTINAAAAIDRADRTGSIDIGKKGDVILLEYPSYRFLPYHLGTNIVQTVIKNGYKIIDKGQKRYAYAGGTFDSCI